MDSLLLKIIFSSESLFESKYGISLMVILPFLTKYTIQRLCLFQKVTEVSRVNTFLYPFFVFMYLLLFFSEWGRFDVFFCVPFWTINFFCCCFSYLPDITSWKFSFNVIPWVRWFIFFKVLSFSFDEAQQIKK